MGSAIHHRVQTEFSYIGESFLMGTVALGKLGSASCRYLKVPFILALRLELVIAYQVSEVYSSASVTV